MNNEAFMWKFQSCMCINSSPVNLNRGLSINSPGHPINTFKSACLEKNRLESNTLRLCKVKYLKKLFASMLRGKTLNFLAN